MRCRTLFAFDGKGRSAGARAFVLGVTEADARTRLLRSDSCSFFDIAGPVPFLSSVLTGTGDPP